jgi:hypothetical protein
MGVCNHRTALMFRIGSTKPRTGNAGSPKALFYRMKQFHSIGVSLSGGPARPPRELTNRLALEWLRASRKRDRVSTSAVYPHPRTSEGRREPIGATAGMYSTEYMLQDRIGGKATLRLHSRVSNASTNRVRTGIFRVGNQSWDEQTVTWITKPAYGPLLGIVTVRGAAPQWVEIDVTAFLKAEQLAGRQFVSVALRTLEHTSAFAGFDSREDGASGPQLVIAP